MDALDSTINIVNSHSTQNVSNVENISYCGLTLKKFLIKCNYVIYIDSAKSFRKYKFKVIAVG